MVNEEEKIRLIHEYRSVLLDRMFDELSRKAPDGSSEHVSNEIVAVAIRIPTALAKADEIPCSTRGLFVLGLQQIIDSCIAGLLTDEAVEWLAKKRNRVG
jgi:hypothetical protein